MTQPNLILLTGSSGLIGKSLAAFLRKKGYEILPCPRDLSLVKDRLEGLFAVIHLAGENIAKGFWTKKKKQRILQSRKEGTRRLVHLLQGLQIPPQVFISTSAAGFYGDREDVADEESGPGTGFLSLVCQEWESEALALKNNKTRIVIARLGYVLSSKGGFLHSLIPLFKYGVGMKIGKHKPIIPWVSLEDVLRGFEFLLQNKDLQGPVNIVSPYPVSQSVFAKALAHQLKRPLLFFVPRCFLIGEKAKALLFPSIPVCPRALQKAGFIFSFPKIEDALKKALFQESPF